eukprot:13018956-Ditylum_brightwellii.AAC.1
MKIKVNKWAIALDEGCGRGHGGHGHGRGRRGCGGRATSGSDAMKPQPPMAGKSHTKMINGVEHHWCGCCASYKPDHGTEENREKCPHYNPNSRRIKAQATATAAAAATPEQSHTAGTATPSPDSTVPAAGSITAAPGTTPIGTIATIPPPEGGNQDALHKAGYLRFWSGAGW